MHRAAPTTKNHWAPNVSSAKVEQTCFSVLYWPLLIALPSWWFFSLLLTINVESVGTLDITTFTPMISFDPPHQAARQADGEGITTLTS